MAKAKGGGKLHPLPFTTFGEIAALGLEAKVHCASCYRQTKVDMADRRLNDRIFAAVPFRCHGMRDRGFAVPLQWRASHLSHATAARVSCVHIAAASPRVGD